MALGKSRRSLGGLSSVADGAPLTSARGVARQHRVFYVATFAEAVYVLHAFEKRTRKTPKREVELAQDRLRALVNRRRTDASKK